MSSSFSLRTVEAMVGPGPVGPPRGNASGARRPSTEGPEANARLTGALGAVLLVLLAAEGFTVVSVRTLLAPHVFIGLVLIPPVVAKVGSTLYRFARFYRGSEEYRRKGPPPTLMRLLGPFVVVLTVAVLGTGVALLFVPIGARHQWLFLHKASFVLWFGAMGLHVLGHLVDTARLAPGDWYWRTRRDVLGAGIRQWTVVATIVIGVLLGLALVGRSGLWP
jgi:hypothetical protein